MKSDIFAGGATSDIQAYNPRQMNRWKDRYKDRQIFRQIDKDIDRLDKQKAIKI